MLRRKQIRVSQVEPKLQQWSPYLRRFDLEYRFRRFFVVRSSQPFDSRCVAHDHVLKRLGRKAPTGNDPVLKPKRASRLYTDSLCEGIADLVPHGQVSSVE